VTAEHQRHRHDHHGVAANSATDPVCGMTVDRARAVTLEADGETLYFCSEHCRHVYASGAHERGADPAHAHSH